MRTAQLRIAVIVLFTLAVIALGVVGYRLLEGYTTIEALYMTAITLSTVGFGEVRPLSDAGRIFTIVLLLMGLGVVAYGATATVEYVTGSIGGGFRRRRMERAIEKLNRHVVVCGYGRVGRSAADALSDNIGNVVIVERDPDRVEQALRDGYLVVHGDATSDEVLRQAGLERASGLIVGTGDDAVNLFVVLSGRALNGNLFIVTRSTDPDNEAKMRLAGADRVVSPYQIGGKHMANIMVRPRVTDFFDVVTLDNGQELWLEEMHIDSNSPMVGRNLGEIDIRKRTGVSLVALYRQSSTGAAILPRAATDLEAGDQIIVLGTREQLAQLEALAQGQEPV